MVSKKKTNGPLKMFKRNFKDMDKILLIITMSLFVLGVLNIITASSRESTMHYEQGIFYYFIRQIVLIIVGLIAGAFIICIDSKKYKALVPILYVVIAGLNIACLFTTAVKGAHNWLPTGIGNFSIQPSELAKPILIVTLSLLFEKYYHKLRNKEINHMPIIWRIIIIGLFIPAIVVLQKDLGTMLILVATFVLMFLASPILNKEKFKTIVVATAVITIVGLAVMFTGGKLLSESQLSRFDFIDPCSKYERGGYQICNAYIAINDGGLTGLGIGKSKQKYSYIPEPHTDSVFAIIAEENGVFIVFAIFVLYSIILKKILDISSKASTLRGRYICLGVATYIFCHILINLGGLFGIMPLTGVPLPFFSYGGSFAVSLIISLALVQRVAIETKNKKIKI